MIELNDVVKKAVQGDKVALEEVVIQIQDVIYNLAIRMLWHPDDAKDATQDILIKVITSLSTFKHKSAFKTWVYRLASNHLINFKKKRFAKRVNFDDYQTHLNQGLSDSIGYTDNKAEQNLLIQEAKIGCSNAMLQCLNEEGRLAYIIGEILEFNSKEGGLILNITPANFRKKLSRARKLLHDFLNKNCGIVNKSNNCRCFKKVDNSIEKGLIEPNNLLFANNTENLNLINKIDQIENEVTLYQSNEVYKTPELLLNELRKVITGNKGFKTRNI